VDLTVALVVLVAAAFVAVAVLAIRGHRRRAARARRRLDALTGIAKRIDAAVTSLGELTVIRSFEALPAPPDPADPAPLVEADLSGRAGLLQAIAAGVAAARSRGERLAAAVVRAEECDAATLARGARSVADVPVYAVGPRAVALVLPGLGRADALGVLARIEAQCPSSGRAVELESGEDAVELAARLLGGQAPHGGA
jgi:hypothetical protein